MTIAKSGNSLVVRDCHADTTCVITLSRALRLPEDSKVYGLPEFSNPSPLLNTDLLGNRLPEAMRQKGEGSHPCLPAQGAVHHL